MSRTGALKIVWQLVFSSISMVMTVQAETSVGVGFGSYHSYQVNVGVNGQNITVDGGFVAW